MAIYSILDHSAAWSMTTLPPRAPSEHDIAAMPKRGIGNLVIDVDDGAAISRSVQTETVFLDPASSDGECGSE